MNQREPSTTDTATSGGNELNPVWLRVPAAIRVSSIKKTRLFELIAEQKIRSRLIKKNRDAKRGIRLISYDSLLDFINNEGTE